MILNSRSQHDSADGPSDVSPHQSSLHSPAVWHPPVTTIMNMKRTMFFSGSFPDGGVGTTGA